MRFSDAASCLLAGLALVNASPVLETETVVGRKEKRWGVIKPKVFIISMVRAQPLMILIFPIDRCPQFGPEADIWYANDKSHGSIGDLLGRNITVPGFSPLFPDAHCLRDGSVCQLTTGESEINAAVTISSLVASHLFDLKDTYFMIGGIAGINPKYGTLGDVAFCKYAVQVALQYEFDAREMPLNFTTGYFPQGSYAPGQYPQSIYGTEVFEVNEALRDIAVNFASTSLPFNDSADAITYRANYAPHGTGPYVAATKAPGIITCDVATSDVYFSGALLGETFENTTKMLTNGGGVYCMTAQEDNATLEALLRAAINKLVDFSRIIVMRTGSDFDRPFPGQSPENNLLYANPGGFEPAIQNIYIAGVKVVQGILSNWRHGYKFADGIKPKNYIGDIFGSLGGQPDFGPGSITNGQPVNPGTETNSRRDMYSKELGANSIVSRTDGKGKAGFERARRAQLAVDIEVA
jgi:purine nucleoside permease